VRTLVQNAAKAGSPPLVPLQGIGCRSRAAGYCAVGQWLQSAVNMIHLFEELSRNRSFRLYCADLKNLSQICHQTSEYFGQMETRKVA